MINFNKLKITTTLSWIALLLWLILIFTLSAQPATQSDGLSKKVTKVIIETVDRAVTLDNDGNTIISLVERFNNLVRKYAHGGVYFVMGLLVINALRQSGFRGYKKIILSLVFCVFYAVSDEVHQLFVPGRGAEVTDVLIDSAGAFIAIGIYGVGDRFLTQISLETGTSRSHGKMAAQAYHCFFGQIGFNKRRP